MRRARRNWPNFRPSCATQSSSASRSASPNDRLLPLRLLIVGRPHGRSQVAIVDDNDCELPPGVQGTIVLRPTVPFTFMLGYQNDPEATRKAWRNLWFHSGDLGTLDEGGNLFFVGRQAHWLRRRGGNISAYEIEVY